MKALHVVKPRYFARMQVPNPDLNAAGADRLIVQPSWVSMCGSDIPFFTGSKRHKSYPLPVGAPIHECFGKVIESTSDLFKPGDQVIAIPESDVDSESPLPLALVRELNHWFRWSKYCSVFHSPPTTL